MSKPVKLCLAILLIPACIGATASVLKVIQTTGSAETIWVALLSGSACWLVVYLLLPRPMWIYVFGHELTHVLWTWLFGGRVKRFRATSKGGHVIVTKDNFLISLAPYFFPVYVAAIVLIFACGNFIWDWSRHFALFHLLIGAAYAFHLTFTWEMLRTHQSDLARHGYLFSLVVIWLGNVILLLAGIPALTAKCDLWTAWKWCWIETGNVFLRIVRIF
jgi:hypothetical protein